MMKNSINFNLNKAPYASPTLEGLSPREIILKLKHYAFLERRYVLRQLPWKLD